MYKNYKDKEKRRKYKREWYKNNPEKAREYNKRWLERHPEGNKEYYKKYPERKWASQSLSGHKRKGFKVDITFDELCNIAKSTSHCYLCGCKLSWTYGKKKILSNSPSLDRTNNEKEINKDNIKIICYRCNRSKSNMLLSEFYKYCETVYKRQPKK